MGEARFSCPPELIRALARNAGIDAAIETGTFRAEGTLILSEAVKRVWTIELDKHLYDRAIARHRSRDGITFLLGSSDEVLRSLATEVDEPVIFWLDAHGGMADHLNSRPSSPAADATKCPLVGELQAVREFTCVTSSCVLIDDARLFLGPRTRIANWPSLLDIIDLLRLDDDRYITILDDIIMAVPKELRSVIDEWWLQQTSDREGRSAHEQQMWEAYNPTPRNAARLLVKSVTPMVLRRAYERHH